MKSFLIALQFLTRIKVASQLTWSDADFGRAVVWFPAVGFLIGLLTALARGLTGMLFSPFLSAILTVACWYFLTGGLHSDGLMDAADGIYSGRDRKRSLEIMNDSCVGANGVAAFVFVVLLKVACVGELMPAWPFLIGIPAAARFGAVLGILRFPYARERGLGRAFQDYAPRHALLKAFVVSLLPLLAVGIVYLYILAGALLVAYGAHRRVTAHLGGLTGDTYGAVIEVTETALLLMATLIVQMNNFFEVTAFI